MLEKITVNKYPFWMFWTYKTEVEIDTKSQIVQSTNVDKKSYYKKVKPIEVIALKYLPALLLLFLMRIPNSLIDLFILIIALLISMLSVFVHQKYHGAFKTYSISMILLSLIIFMMVSGAGRYLNLFINYIITIYIIAFIAYDYYIHDYKNYYYLIDVENIGKVTLAKKKEQTLFKIPFFKKYLINNKKVGFDLMFHYRFGGYYFYTDTELTRIEND